MYQLTSETYGTQVSVLAEGGEMREMPLSPVRAAIPGHEAHGWTVTQRSYNSKRDCVCANNFSLLFEGLCVVIWRTSATDGFLFVG